MGTAHANKNCPPWEEAGRCTRPWAALPRPWHWEAGWPSPSAHPQSSSSWLGKVQQLHWVPQEHYVVIACIHYSCLKSLNFMPHSSGPGYQRRGEARAAVIS